MINGINVLIILGIIIAETLSQTLARSYRDGATKGKGHPFHWKKDFWKITISFLLYILILYLLLKTYDYSHFAISNALWDSGTVIGTSLVGYFYFNEKFNNYEYLGLSFVVIGALIIGFKSDDVSSLSSIKTKK